MRVCIVYDCLFPHTVGGAERWYRNLAERLVQEGHEVSYLTLRQWDRGERPEIDRRVRVVCAGPRMSLYKPEGPRRVLPPLRFGAGVLWHLLRHGRRYDVVHTASFPYFSLLAAGAVRPFHRFELIVDWHEVWSGSYWREYLGPLGGRVGQAVQILCARIPQRAFCFSRLHARRLRAEGLRGEVTVLEGEYAGPTEPAGGPEPPGEPLVVFAGRLIPEKRVTLAVDAVAIAIARMPELRAVFYGDGPERGKLLGAIARHGLEGRIEAPGFADAAVLHADQRRGLCMLSTSRREGYGMVVVEAAAQGTPSIVVAGEDNASVELIEQGVNGIVVAEPDAELVAQAIEWIAGRGEELRANTEAWFRENAERLSLESSLQKVLASYPDPSAASARA